MSTEWEVQEPVKSWAFQIPLTLTQESGKLEDFFFFI